MFTLWHPQENYQHTGIVLMLQNLDAVPHLQHLLFFYFSCNLRTKNRSSRNMRVNGVLIATHVQRLPVHFIQVMDAIWK